MRKLKFKKIDAFATSKSDGNPAGYITLPPKDTLSHAEMLQIAKELKGFVNEVGFIYQNKNNVFDLTFYSSEREVAFCGHATIAIMYDLISQNSKLINTKHFQIKTNKGLSIVENRILNENAIFIMSPLPVEQQHNLAVISIAKAMNINAADINQNLPIKIINAGLATLIIPLNTLDNLINVYPDINVLKEFCVESKIDIIEIFTQKVSDSNNDYRTRVFAPTFGYLDDPATGSGNSAFGYYLIENGLWNKQTINIEQNADLTKYNIVKLQQQKDNNGQTRVLFGGSAVTRIEGDYIIY